jgi:hypothetical protein
MRDSEFASLHTGWLSRTHGGQDVLWWSCGAQMSYEDLVLTHLRQVQDLPELVQTDIATRVSGYIQIAKAAKDESLLATFASAAMEEQAKAIGLGAITTDPRWAAPALAEAWCYATLSLTKGYLDRPAAKTIIEAIESFALGAESTARACASAK